MSIMRVLEAGGMVLQYDTEDVESLHFSAPHDVRDATPPGAGYAEWELGQAHMHLHVRFKDGKKPTWVEKE